MSTLEERRAASSLSPLSSSTSVSASRNTPLFSPISTSSFQVLPPSKDLIVAPKARFFFSSSWYRPRINEPSGSSRAGEEQANEYGESILSLTGSLQVLPWSVERASKMATRSCSSANQLSRSVRSLRQATEGSRSSWSVSMTTTGLLQVRPLSEERTVMMRPPFGHFSL